MSAQEKEGNVGSEDASAFKSKTLTMGHSEEELAQMGAEILGAEPVEEPVEAPVEEPSTPAPEPEAPVQDAQTELDELKAQLEQAKHESAGRLGEIAQLRENTRNQGAILDMMQNQARTAQAAQAPQGPQIDPDGVVTGQQLIDVLTGFAKTAGATYGTPLQTLQNAVSRLTTQAELGTGYNDVMQSEVLPFLEANPELQAMAQGADPKVLHAIGLGLRKMKQATTPTAGRTSVTAPPPPPPVFPSSNPGGGPAPGLTMAGVRALARSPKDFEDLSPLEQASLIPQD